MRALTVLCIIPPLLAAGCCKPSSYWYQPTRSLEQARDDYCACRGDARREASEAVADEYLNDAFSPIASPRAYSTPHDRVGLGDSPFDAWSTWGQLHRDNLFTGCMERNGYRRVKADRLPTKVRRRRLSMAAIAGR
jgi:hypothetical protein